MKKISYPVSDSNANNQYYIYNIIGEVEKELLGDIDIKKIINDKHNEIHEVTKSPVAEGTPIYVYRSEIN